MEYISQLTIFQYSFANFIFCIWKIIPTHLKYFNNENYVIININKHNMDWYSVVVYKSSLDKTNSEWKQKTCIQVAGKLSCDSSLYNAFTQWQ